MNREKGVYNRLTTILSGCYCSSKSVKLRKERSLREKQKAFAREFRGYLMMSLSLALPGARPLKSSTSLQFTCSLFWTFNLLEVKSRESKKSDRHKYKTVLFSPDFSLAFLTLRLRKIPNFSGPTCMSPSYCLSESYGLDSLGSPYAEGCVVYSVEPPFA